MDCNVGYMYLRHSFMNKWKPKGEFTAIDIGFEYYVIKFQNMEDLAHVMANGPWLIGENYLTIQRWRPNFTASEEKISKIGHLASACILEPHHMEYDDFNPSNQELQPELYGDFGNWMIAGH
ncbi:hypothetical protein V2J09_012728 [Rumex salicifolius]